MDAAAGYDRRVVLGTALQAAARLATALVAFALIAILARVLDKDAFGRFGATVALFQVLDVFVDFGSMQSAVRTVALDPSAARAAVRAAVQFRLATAVVSILASAAIAWGSGDPQAGLVTLASLTFFSHAAGVGVAVLHADIDFKRSEAFRVAGSLLGLVGVLALVSAGARDAGSMLVAVYAGLALGNIGLALSVRSDLPDGGASIDRSGFFRESLALGLGAVVRQGYYSLNPILARALGGDLAAADFIPAYRLTGFSILFSVYFGAAALPALVRLRETNPAALPAFVRKWTLALLALGIAIGGGMFLLREPLLVLLFGAEYGSTAPVLAPMCITTALIHVGGFALTRLVADGRAKSALGLSLAGLAANLATNLALTPTMGARGAAWASVVTEGVVAIGALAMLTLRKRCGHCDGFSCYTPACGLAGAPCGATTCEDSGCPVKECAARAPQ